MQDMKPDSSVFGTESLQWNEGFCIGIQDLIRLNLFIKEWLIHHILYEDKLIGLSMPKG